MKTTGDAILFQLKSLGDAQAETLARRLRISVQAVRQRLERLLAEQLVEFVDQPSGRGRPRRMWSLTTQAVSLFPDTHAQLTVDLIGSIRAELGDTAFTRLLDRRAQEITATYRKKLDREPDVARKLRALADNGRLKVIWLASRNDRTARICWSKTIARFAPRPPFVKGFAASNSRCFATCWDRTGRSTGRITCSPALAAALIRLPAHRDRFQRGQHDTPTAHLRNLRREQDALPCALSRPRGPHHAAARI